MEALDFTQKLVNYWASDLRGQIVGEERLSESRALNLQRHVRGNRGSQGIKTNGRPKYLVACFVGDLWHDLRQRLFEVK
jgi:hypothetical protein